MSNVLFITRHSGAREWAQAHVTALAASADFIVHLAPERIAALAPGDVVVGTLPVQLIADVNARGARYLHLALDLPAEARPRADLGKEDADLTREEMERYGARLEPFMAIALERAARPDADDGPAPAEKAALHRCRTWKNRALKAVGFSLAITIALCSGFSTNILSPVVTSFLVTPDAGPPTMRWWAHNIGAGLLFVLGLMAATAALYRWRNRFFAHQIVPRRDSVKEPCRVLITALSYDGRDEPPARDSPPPPLPGNLLLGALQNNPQLDLDLFRLTKKGFEKKLTADGAALPSWAKLNWLTNLVAIAAHTGGLDTVVVVPSIDGKDRKGSNLRFETFRECVLILWGRSRSAARPLRVIKAKPRDYEDYQDQLDGIDQAIELSGARAEREVCIDITSGTKPMSVAGAVNTMNKDHTFIYVTNERHFVVFDARIGLDGGF